MSSFFDMGGYGFYVWPALGLTAVILIAMAAASLRKLRASDAALREAEAANPRRERRHEA